MEENIHGAVKRCRDFFQKGKTLSYEFRYSQLEALEKNIREYEEEVLQGLKQDLNKSRYEAFMCELGLVYGDISYAKKNLKKWTKPKRVIGNLSQLPAMGHIYKEPYGVVLIISPWNYPFQLTMAPLIGAICAGNTVVVKPSAYSGNSSHIIEKIIKQSFDQDFVYVVQGGREENSKLLEEKFDYIFFTGSPEVGRVVMEAAAKKLTPVTLELGGKSPCIVGKTADISKTAKRILFGKLLNGGQTCVAPDYVLVHRDVKETLISELKRIYEQTIPTEEYYLENFPKIINEKHFDRAARLIKGESLLYGGDFNGDSRQIGFTMVDEPEFNSPIMREEIFAPILPIIGWDDLNQVEELLHGREKPLALYLFTKDKGEVDRVLTNVSFGGGCINDTLLHILSNKMPFGGVGQSGMGQYHGRESFETFSHTKSVLKKSWKFDMALRHHPYKDGKKKLPEFLFR